MAYCHQPHTGVRWDLPTWEPESFKKAVKALHDTGLQICVHCVGDAAVDLTLDAFEAAMKANPRTDPRHRIEHCVLTTPQATQRIKDLGVVVCTQPQFIRLGGDQYVGLFGAERAKRIMVTREWLKAGIHLALGSDAPTTPWYNPQTTLAAAMSRATPSNKRFEPDQVMTIQEALRAHTMGAAYAGHEEKTKGSIEPGKLADFAVWGADPMTATPTKMLTIPIVMTIIGGKIVYQA
jgi:predicted amidohydrolase YtcJ